MNQTLDLDTESKRSSENSPQTTLHRQDSCGLPRQGQHLAPWVYVHHGGGGQVLPVKKKMTRERRVGETGGSAQQSGRGAVTFHCSPDP